MNLTKEVLEKEKGLYLKADDHFENVYIVSNIAQVILSITSITNIKPNYEFLGCKGWRVKTKEVEKYKLFLQAIMDSSKYLD